MFLTIERVFIFIATRFFKWIINIAGVLAYMEVLTYILLAFFGLITLIGLLL